MQVSEWFDHIAKSLISFKNVRCWPDYKATLQYFSAPALPSVRRSGAIQFPPPLSSPTDVVLILCNHQSDMDQFLVCSSVHYYDEPISTGSTSSTSSTSSASSTSPTIPIRLTGFTHQAFESLPGVGNMVGKNLIGLAKGETQAQIQAKIQLFLDQGYNCFLLFPEGTFLHQDTFAKSQEFQAKEGIPADMRLQRTLYPKFGALHAFVDLVKDRLAYIVDITIDYYDYDAPKSDWSYFLYPSLTHSFFKKMSPPYMHATVIPVREKWADFMEKEWLVKLWRKKDARLRVRAERQLR